MVLTESQLAHNKPDELPVDPDTEHVESVDDDQLAEIELNESAALALQELEGLDDSIIEQIDESDDYQETVAFEGTSLDDFCDEEPDRAKG